MTDVLRVKAAELPFSSLVLVGGCRLQWGSLTGILS